MTIPVQHVYSQVFPEVSTPAMQQKQQEQENEKLAFQYYGDKDYEKNQVEHGYPPARQCLRQGEAPFEMLLTPGPR